MPGHIQYTNTDMSPYIYIYIWGHVILSYVEQAPGCCFLLRSGSIVDISAYIGSNSALESTVGHLLKVLSLALHCCQILFCILQIIAIHMYFSFKRMVVHAP